MFDKNDSGNISFGVIKNGRKLFIKYAGAKPINANIPAEEAVARMKDAVSVYRDLSHPVLLNLIDTIETDGGYAIVTEWFGGACLHAYWDFDSLPKYSHPNSPTVLYKSLPFEKKLNSFMKILMFHEHVAKKDYVAVDFYDGSIMYDFETDETKVCDIEFYGKRPYINRRGRMWGSSRFMSPEEFNKGASIDETTNVYTMGTLMFFVFGDERDKDFAKWTAGKKLFDIAAKATSKNKRDRFKSISEMTQAVEESL